MKKLFRSVLIALTAVIFLAGCKDENPRELIINKWAITDVKLDTGEKMTEEEQKVMKSLVMDFTKEGKLIVTGLPDGAQTGSYTLSEDGKTLTTTNPSGVSTPNTVLTLSKNKLVFKDPKAGLTFSTEKKK